MKNSLIMMMAMGLLIVACNKDSKPVEQTPEVSITKLLELTGEADPKTDYQEVAKEILKTQQDHLIKNYVDFIARNSGSADELRSNGLANLYTSKPLETLSAFETKTADEQKILTESLTFGLLNNFQQELNKENAKSLIVGSNLDVYNHELAKTILGNVLEKLPKSN